MTTALDNLTAALGNLRRPPVVLCIGSDRVTGDCIGPLVGHLLSSRPLPCAVIGTLSEPVTALNLDQTVRFIRQRYAGRKVIAVDSCVGSASDLGKIRIGKGSIKPGLACGKSLPKVGDVSITATVASGAADNLYSVRLGFVYGLAVKISELITSALCSESLPATLTYK